MKYDAKKFIAHCMTRPELWVEVSQKIKLSPDGLTIESPEVKELNPIKIVNRWPWWARAISILRKKSDKGVGDIVERWTKWTCIKWIVDRTIKECGCKRRGVELNARFTF